MVDPITISLGTVVATWLGSKLLDKSFDGVWQQIGRHISPDVLAKAIESALSGEQLLIGQDQILEKIESVGQQSATLDRRHFELQIRVLAEKVALLEDRDREHLDKKGLEIWDRLQCEINAYQFREASLTANDLREWLDTEGRTASRETRGRGLILIAHAVLASGGFESEPRQEAIVSAWNLLRKAKAEIGDDASELDRVRLAGLEAKLLCIEGKEEDGLSVLGESKHEIAVSLKLTVFVEREKPEDGLKLVQQCGLHEKWCDRAVTLYVQHGELDEAKAVIEWAKVKADTTTYHRCIVAYGHAALRRIMFGGDTTRSSWALSETQVNELSDLLEVLRPPLLVAEGTGFVANGLQSEALASAVTCSHLLRHRETCNKYADLLATSKPVHLEYGRAALRRDVDTPSDLPDRIRDDHPRSFEAKVLAGILEGRQLKRPVSAFSEIMNCRSLATTDEQRLRFSTALMEVAQDIGDEAVATAVDTIRELLGSQHEFVKRLNVIVLLSQQATDEAIASLEENCDKSDPLWLKLSADAQVQKGNREDALAMLAKSAEMLRHPDLLELAAGLAHEVGDFSALARMLELLVQVEPGSERHVRNLANCYLQLNDFTLAQPWLERLRTLAPKDDVASINLAVCHSLSGDLDRAVGLYDRVIDANPLNKDALLRRAGLLSSMGFADRAFQSLEDVRDRFWSDLEFLAQYLNIGYSAKRESEAHEAFLRLLELQSESEEGRQVLISLHIDEVKSMFENQAKTRDEYFERLTNADSDAPVF